MSAADRFRELLVDYSAGAAPALHIDPDGFNEAIQQHGIGCEYRKAVYCPCVRPETRQANSACELCAGMGLLYPEELREPTIALVVNRMPRRKAAPLGELVTGTVVVTTLSEIVPGQGDMLLPDGEIHVVNEVLFRAQQQVDPISLDAHLYDDQEPPRRRKPVAERLRYDRGVEIDWVYWIDGDYPREKLVQGRAGVDYDLVDGVIRWRDGHGPQAGRAYTVRYRAQAAYVLRPGEPMARAEGGVLMPWRTEGQRLDKLGAQDLLQ